jgi:hypothetical protein
MRSARFAGIIGEPGDERPAPETFVTSQTYLIPAATRFPELPLSMSRRDHKTVRLPFEDLRARQFSRLGVSLCVLSSHNDVTGSAPYLCQRNELFSRH